MKITVLLFITLMVFSANVSAADNLREKLKEFQKQPEQLQKSMLNSSLRDDMYEFLLNNEDVSLKDFSKIRMAAYISEITEKELSEKYKANRETFRKKITNKRDQEIFRIAVILQDEQNWRQFYLCDNAKAKSTSLWELSSFKKVRELRSGGPKDRYSEGWTSINENILQECKFETGAIYFLLTSYRSKNLREKYNELMLRIIKEDQVDYDYLYYPVDTLNGGFINEYLLFFTNVNSLKDRLILSREQVEFIADDILTKHQEIFNFHSAFYFPEDLNGGVNEYALHDGIQALINVSTWLREYKLDDLNDKLIQRFVTDELVLREIKYYLHFKEFYQYLQQKLGADIFKKI